MAKQRLSVEQFIATGKSSGGAGTEIEFSEFYAGTGVGGGAWEKTGVTGLTPSQTPAAYYTESGKAGYLVDSSGSEWVKVVPAFPVLVPEQMGARGNQSTDDYLPITISVLFLEEIALATPQFVGTVFFSRKYAVSQGVSLKRRVGYNAAPGSTINGLGRATGGITLENGNWYGRNILPIINGFPEFGLKAVGTDVANIFVGAITNCGDALVLSTSVATDPNMFDSNFEVQQIGAVTNGIVFESEETCVMQGNEVKVNFISNFSGAATTWRTASVNTPDWDSNKVVFQATDAVNTNPNSKVLHNPLSYGISRFIFRVETWCGGLASTGMFIDGRFNDLDCYMNLAGPVLIGQINIKGASNQINFTDAFNSTQTPIGFVNSPNSLASFNGGVPIYRNSQQFVYTLTADWPAGDNRTMYGYHSCLDGSSNLFKAIPPVIGTQRGCVVERIFDNSLTNPYEFLLIMKNTSGATLLSGSTVNIKLSFCLH